MPVSSLVTAKSKPGMIDVVMVRVSSDNGSRTISVMLPSAAMATMLPSSMYLPSRKRGGSRRARCCAALNGVYSSTVPSGQIQPHHTRPSTMVAATVTRARARWPSHWRAASMVAKAARGSKRKNKSASGKAALCCRAVKSR